jgi:hypothetical protein
MDTHNTHTDPIDTSAAQEITPHEHARIDDLESRMLESGQAIDLPLAHTFTPGVYRRTILMPAGTLATSLIHNTEHQYVIVAGSVSVYIPGVGVEHIRAPYFGITKPGTRRVLYVHEDCVWATYHPTTPEEDAIDDPADRVAAIGERIIERRELPGGMTMRDLYLAQLEEAKSAGLLSTPGPQDSNGPKETAK